MVGRGFNRVFSVNFLCIPFFHGCTLIYRVKERLLKEKEVKIGEKACCVNLMHLMNVSGEWGVGERRERDRMLGLLGFCSFSSIFLYITQIT